MLDDYSKNKLQQMELDDGTKLRIAELNQPLPLKDGTTYFPEPFDDANCPDKFWVEDPFDKYLPKTKGFISDFIYFLRGTESPTKYSVWSALWALSTIVKREAFIKWFPSKIYSNFYCILVGTAGAKKTYSLSQLTSCIENMTDYMKLYYVPIKKINLLKNKFTPEAVLQAMEMNQEEMEILDDNGKAMVNDKTNLPLRHTGTSELGIILTEMSVAINKQKYSENMINYLLDLYDAHDNWEMTSVGGGKKKLKSLHTTFIAATTPDGFSESIPKQASGDGFISRTVLVYQDRNPRRFLMPRETPGAPDKKELTKRLAWIAVNSLGEYKLTPAAHKYMEDWYLRFRSKLEKHPETEGVYSRMNLLLLKVSMLLRIQEYSHHNYITLQNVKDAERLIEATYNDVPWLLANITQSDRYYKDRDRIEDHIKRNPNKTRRDLLQNTGIKASDFTLAVDDLAAAGRIVAVDESGKRKDKPNHSSKEKYNYIGDTSLYQRGFA